MKFRWLSWIIVAVALCAAGSLLRAAPQVPSQRPVPSQAGGAADVLRQVSTLQATVNALQANSTIYKQQIALLQAGGGVAFTPVAAALAAATDNVSFNGYELRSVASPTASTSAATKGYTDGKAGLLITAGSNMGSDVIGASTAYLLGTGASAASSVAATVAVATRNGTLRNFFATLKVAPGTTATVIFNVLTVSGTSGAQTSTTISCTTLGTAKVCSDTTHTANISAGDLVEFQVVSSAGTAAGPQVSLELL